MFLVIKNDTINLKDISRLSRQKNTIKIYFISKPDHAEYCFENENDATEVEYKIFQNLEERGLIV